MALVRISNALIDDVTQGLNALSLNLRKTTVNPLCPEAEKGVMGGPLFSLALDALWGDNLPLKDVIPDEWLSRVTDFRVRVVRTDGRQLCVLVVKAADGKEFLAPPLTDRWSTIITLHESKLSDNPFFTKFIEDYQRYDTALKELRAKFVMLNKQVIGLLTSSKSLNDAVKRFPDILLYIPNSYKDLLEKKVSRAPKEEPKPIPNEFDPSFVSSMGVLKTIQAC